MADPKTYSEEEFAAVQQQLDALKANRDEALTEAKKAKASLKNYEGIDPSEYKTLKEAAAEAERKKALAEGNLEVWKKQVTDAHQAEMKAQAAKVEKMQRALDKRKVARLTEELAKADAIPEMMELLVLKGSASVQLRETDDDWEEFVSDGKGNPLVADGSGTPMTMSQFVEKSLKAQYPGAFKGTGSSGGGAAKSHAGGGGQKSVAADGASIMANLADIASGKLSVPIAQ